MPLITVNGTLYVHITDCAIFGTPFFAAVNGGFVLVRLYGFASLGEPGSNVLTVDATSFASVTAFDGAMIVDGAATVASGGGLNIHIVDSAQLGLTYYTAPGVNVDLRSLASQINGLNSGSTTLVNGVSPAISVTTLTSTSRIVATYSNTNPSSAIGFLSVPVASRSAGSPGTFHIVSLNTTRGIVLGDQSVVEWHLVDTGV